MCGNAEMAINEENADSMVLERREEWENIIEIASAGEGV